ncbi:hypothetical protein Poli38472_005428 [Pythium oligandrum]|uniref:Uncharacterized protein n=1 Tax=Pythium oligandrum TaxID=41045 RepID=A0A8K1CHH1_PYTOL|nr:hypothetical protein Poli38472_005428 [Pythium oligandrum]|eukprot:TMW62810.1 hypothetical protein Poli38472_005428 [Pythium oligandrum]
MPLPTGAQEGIKYAEIVLDEKARQLQESGLSSHEVAVKIEAEKSSHGHHVGGERPPQSMWLLAYCFLGIMVSFTLNGIVLEKMTTHRVLGEMSLTFVFCLFYSAVALALRYINKEKPSTMPQSKLMIVGLLAFGSTISSMIALRYVTFITRILGKSCKSIPVMVVGVFLGKSYAFKKYLSVVVLSIGVAIFLVGTAHEKQHRAAQSNDEHHRDDHGRTPNLFLGFSLLIISLLFDGATGALEDRFLEKYHIGAFDLMYVVNIWKSLFAFIGMVFVGEIPVFVEQAVPALPNLFLLSATGALGQAFIFFTISKFGALTTSIIGTCRKVLSIVLSVILFGHVLSAEQSIGLAVAFVGIGLNWARCQMCSKKPAKKEQEETKDLEAEELLEASDDTADSEGSDDDMSPINHDRSDLRAMQPRDELLHSKEVERGLELVNVWHRHHEHEDEKNVAHAV